MTVIRYRRGDGWLSWLIVAILVAVIVWLFVKVRKLEKKLWQSQNI